MSFGMKKIINRAVATSVVMIIASLLTVTAFALVATWVKETYKATAKSDSFTVGIGEDRAKITDAVTIGASGFCAFNVSNLNTGNNDTGLYDIIIMPTVVTDTQYLSCNAGTEYLYDVSGVQSSGAESYTASPTGAVVYTGASEASFTVSSSSAEDVSLRVAVVSHTGHNYFVGSFYELQMVSTGYLRNFGNEETGRQGIISNGTYADGEIHDFIIDMSRANVYIVYDLTIENEYTFRSPGTFNLLMSDITLSADFTIEHDYAGVYAITTLGGKIKGDTGNGVTEIFSVKAPRAYYLTDTMVGADGLFTAQDVIENSVTLEKSSDNVDFTSALNADYLAALKTDAEIYIRSYIENCTYYGVKSDGTRVNYLLSDISLPSVYKGYDVVYTYGGTVGGINFTDGRVTRSGTDLNGSVDITITENYSSTPTTTSVTVNNITVPGTEITSSRTAFIGALGGFIVENQPTGSNLSFNNDMYVHGIDIYAFILRYCAESGFDPDGFSLKYSENGLTFDTLAAKDGKQGIYTVNNVTFTSVSDVIGLSGYTDVRQIIVNHPYYTAEGSETVQLFDGSDVLAGSFTLYYKGTTIPERNHYIEGIAPQIYISGSNTAVTVLNIKDTGTYNGQSQLISPTRFSCKPTDGSYIVYKMYYVNSDTIDALNAVDAYVATLSLNDSEKALARADIVSDILEQSAVPSLSMQDYLDSIGKTMSAFSASETYSGKDLLGVQGEDSLFALADGVLELVPETLQVYGGTLVLVGEIKYTDSDTFIYYLMRQLYSPADGLGGSSISYTSGNTFDSVFGRSEISWLTTTILPLQVSAPRWVTRITYTVDNGSGSYTQTLETAYNNNQYTSVAMPVSAPCDYFSIVWNEAGRYDVNVSSDKIPPENSTVNISVTLTDGSNAVTENYSFVIPGVYLYNRDVNDIWVYLRMLQTYGNAEGYLLSDNLKKEISLFDCRKTIIDSNANAENINMDYLIEKGIIEISSLSTAGVSGSEGSYSVSSGHIFNLEGVQYAIGTAEMKFDGLEHIVGLAPFYKAQTTSLICLSLKNCGVTTGMLEGSGSELLPLYRQNVLETLDISENSSIVIVPSHSFYRTVTYLDMSGCNVESIDGIENDLVQLVTFRAESNIIKNFYPLTKISTLKTVYIGENSVEGDTARYYGTHGKINMCNIVAMLHNGIDVKVESGQSIIVYECVSGTPNIYYFKGGMTPTSSINDSLVSTYGILSDNGYLISLVDERYAVAVNSMFNYFDYHVTDSSFATAKDSIFPDDIEIGQTGSAVTYSVNVEDLNAGTTAETRTYRIHLTGGGSDGEIYREVTFRVLGPTAQ